MVSSCLWYGYRVQHDLHVILIRAATIVQNDTAGGTAETPTRVTATDRMSPPASGPLMALRLVWRHAGPGPCVMSTYVLMRNLCDDNHHDMYVMVRTSRTISATALPSPPRPWPAALPSPVAARAPITGGHGTFDVSCVGTHCALGTLPCPAQGTGVVVIGGHVVGGRVVVCATHVVGNSGRTE